MKPSDFEKEYPGTLVPIPEGKRAVAFIPNPLPPALTMDAEIQRLNEMALLDL
jgi:hypothetical protein